MAYLMRHHKADLVLLAGELEEVGSEDFTKIRLKEIIIQSKNYEEEVVKALLEGIVSERREEADRVEHERKERDEFELAKLRLEQQERIEMERIRAENQNRSFESEGTVSIASTGRAKTLDEVVKTIRLLTVKIPTKPEGWNYFFNSLEKAFTSEGVADTSKAKVLICLLGDKAANLLTYLEEKDYDDYEALKTLVLREYEPSPKVCLEKFKLAKRNQDENFIQFATRLTSMWSYYCKLRKASDAEEINQLVVADKLYETLDSDTAIHISTKIGEGWLKPRELAKECDIFFAARGKSYAPKFQRENEIGRNIPEEKARERPNEFARSNMNKQGDLTPKKGRSDSDLKNYACFKCGSPNHLKRDCPKGNLNSKDKAVRVNLTSTGIESENEEETVVIAKVGVSGKVMSKQSIKNNLCELEKIKISVNGKVANALIDTGSQITVIRKDLIPKNCTRNRSVIYLQGIFGPPVKCDLVKVPMAIVNASSKKQVLCAAVSRLVEEIIMPSQVYHSLRKIGESASSEKEVNRRQMTESDTIDSRCSKTNFRKDQCSEIEKGETLVYSVRTAQYNTKETSDLGLNEVNQIVEMGSKGQQDFGDLAPKGQFGLDQNKCPELAEAWNKARRGRSKFCIDKGFLFHKDDLLAENTAKLIVPKCRREELIARAHSSLLSGHMGAKRTLERIKDFFYWEGLKSDVQKFCKACVECQLSRPGRVEERTAGAAGITPKISGQVINLDLIELHSKINTKEGNHSLWLIDKQGSWAEQVPIDRRTIESTCDTLIQKFSGTDKGKGEELNKGTMGQSNVIHSPGVQQLGEDALSRLN